MSCAGHWRLRHVIGNIILLTQLRSRSTGAISLEAKKEYAAKTRQSNCAASLRLEDFKATLADGGKACPRVRGR